MNIATTHAPITSSSSTAPQANLSQIPEQNFEPNVQPYDGCGARGRGGCSHGGHGSIQCQVCHIYGHDASIAITSSRDTLFLNYLLVSHLLPLNPAWQSYTLAFISLPTLALHHLAKPSLH